MRKLATLEEIEAWLEDNGGLIHDRYIEMREEREKRLANEIDLVPPVVKPHAYPGFRLRGVEITIHPKQSDTTHWRGKISFIAPFDAPWSIALRRTGLHLTHQVNRFRERQRVVADMGRQMGWQYVYTLEMRKTAWVNFTTRSMLADTFAITEPARPS